jgi:hypothetical protein
MKQNTQQLPTKLLTLIMAGVTGIDMSDYKA